MKDFNVEFKYGHLYDTETKKRMIISDSTKMKISIHLTDLLEADPNLKFTNPLNSEDKAIEVNKVMAKRKAKSFIKILNSGTKLYFEITAGIRKQNDNTEPIYGLFRVELLEDLYVYNKTTEIKNARFFDCQCEVDHCLTELEYFEKIRAASLNDAYTKTYELYFAMYGKSTANSFDRFYSDKSLGSVIRTVAEGALSKTARTE